MPAVSIKLLGDYPLGSRGESVEIEDEGREAEIFNGFAHSLPGLEDLVAKVGAEEELEAFAVGSWNGHIGRGSKFRKKAFGDPYDQAVLPVLTDQHLPAFQPLYLAGLTEVLQSNLTGSLL